jgi:DNA-binding transcriptional MerR regulator
MNEEAIREAARHPIQVVARRTGLSADVIRAWERRYGAVAPQRTTTRRRLYSDAEIRRLLLLRRATLAGRTIGDVASLDTDELARLVEADERAAAAAPRAPDASGVAPEHDILRACLDAAERPDAARLRLALRRASVELSTPILLERVLAPLLRAVGERWERGRTAIDQEHIVTSLVHALLEALREDRDRPTSGPALLVATPAGQRHELGALMATVSALDEGWRVVHAGADLPAENIAHAALTSGAAAVALSIAHKTGEQPLAGELKRLAALLPPGVTLLVGGSAAHTFDAVLREIGARRLDTLGALRTELSRLRDALQT